MKTENGRKRRLIIGAAAIVVVAAVALLIPKSRGKVDTDPAAVRERPKAGVTGRLAPGVAEQAASIWQGGSYVSAANSALEVVNRQRASAGLPALAWNEDLASCGVVRASEITRNFSHTRPSGQDWYTLSPDLMYGENLAYGFNSPDSVVAAWMNSPHHRDNIMNGNYRTCGIGIYTQGNTWYWAQEFGY